MRPSAWVSRQRRVERGTPAGGARRDAGHGGRTRRRNWSISARLSLGPARMRDDDLRRRRPARSAAATSSRFSSTLTTHVRRREPPQLRQVHVLGAADACDRRRRAPPGGCKSRCARPGNGPGPAPRRVRSGWARGWRCAGRSSVLSPGGARQAGSKTTHRDRSDINLLYLDSLIFHSLCMDAAPVLNGSRRVEAPPGSVK